MLVFAGIAPHGSSVIEELAGEERQLFKPTRDAMEKFGSTLTSYNPDTIIVLTPHGLRLKGFNAVYTTAYCRGSLSGGGNTVSTEFQCDQQLAGQILDQIEKLGIPVVGANYGALEGPASNIEMDWGTLIPLWFCGAQQEEKPQIVVIAPTREIPLTDLVQLGEVIGKIAQLSDKKIALIASADQSHTHDANGPYGYHPAAQVVDERIVETVKQNDLEQLLALNPQEVEDAKPDSIWQMLILHGALKVVPMTGQLLSYQAPTYFGMMVATYER